MIQDHNTQQKSILFEQNTLTNTHQTLSKSELGCCKNQDWAKVRKKHAKPQKESPGSDRSFLIKFPPESKWKGAHCKYQLIKEPNEGRAMIAQQLGISGQSTQRQIQITLTLLNLLMITHEAKEDQQDVKSKEHLQQALKEIFVKRRDAKYFRPSQGYSNDGLCQKPLISVSQSASKMHSSPSSLCLDTTDISDTTYSTSLTGSIKRLIQENKGNQNRILQQQTTRIHEDSTFEKDFDQSEIQLKKRKSQKKRGRPPNKRRCQTDSGCSNYQERSKTSSSQLTNYSKIKIQRSETFEQNQKLINPIEFLSSDLQQQITTSEKSQTSQFKISINLKNIYYDNDLDNKSLIDSDFEHSNSDDEFSNEFDHKTNQDSQEHANLSDICSQDYPEDFILLDYEDASPTSSDLLGVLRQIKLQQKLFGIEFMVDEVLSYDLDIVEDNSIAI
ncbi:UNKNOWN [Stylonychia lemnae]|uniref:Uncharacterized protein n=1 Tax=Stylonychia lemnae TaxID=5949 RepID=A0A078AW16_STYLE|nr:UNKNOWN [Stylonychia lemnae]|eukprot:CDW86364.1 UNKNOWN [Stylonychia lemnae]